MSKLVHPRQSDAPAEATRSGIVPRGVGRTSRPPVAGAIDPQPARSELVEVPAGAPAPASRFPALPPPARGAGASTLPPPYRVAQHPGSLRPAPAPSVGRPVPRPSSVLADRRGTFAPVGSHVAESGSHPAAASGSYPIGHAPSSLPPPAPSRPAPSASGFFAPSATEPFASVDTWRPPRSRRLALLGALVASVAAVVLLAVALWSPPAPGVLHVTTAPVDATLYVDGRVVEGNSPFVLTSLETGVAHAVEVRADGYRAWRAELTVDPGSELVLPLVELLQIEELPGAPPAPVAVPEGPAAATEPAVAPHAPDDRGERTRVARPAAAPPTSASAEVKATGKTAAAEPATGVLRLNSRPWSQVWIDGEHVGHTPLTSLSLPAGRHRVRLENEGFELQKQVTITIPAGETVTEIVNLAE